MRTINVDLTKDIIIEINQSEYGTGNVYLAFNKKGVPMSFDASDRLLVKVKLSEIHIGGINVGYNKSMNAFPLGIKRAWTEIAGTYEARLVFIKDEEEADKYPATCIVKEGNSNDK